MFGRDRLTKQRLNDEPYNLDSVRSKQEIEPTYLLPMGLPNSRKLTVLRHQEFPSAIREGKERQTYSFR